MTILSLHHVAITVPAERIDDARRFYSELLGLEERTRPEAELGRPGIWYRVGVAELHIQCRPAAQSDDSDRHPAFVVDNLPGLRQRMGAAGVRIEEAPPLSDHERFFARDPFGNRLEFLTEPRE